MGSLTLIDKIEIQVVVDNATDSLSSIPDHAESEFAYLERHGMRELSGDSLCCACHGLSLLITATRGDLKHCVLFDSGPEEYAFERNSGRLGLPAHYRKSDNESWQPDPLLMDERFLMVNVEGKGLVLFIACSHAGVVNVLKHARDCAGGEPIHAVMGGFHLAGANEEIIPET